MWYPRFFSFILLAFLPGCSIGPFVTEDAGDYNRAVAVAQDRMILSNIVRASQRHPIHFTSIQKISARTTLERGAGFSFPFGGNSTELFGATPSIKLTESPLVEIAVLNSKDFLTGMSAPIREEVFLHYWDAGWPKDFLLYMFIERLELVTSNGDRIVVNNENSGNCGKLFRNVVSQLAPDEAINLSPLTVGAQHPNKAAISESTGTAKPNSQSLLQVPADANLSHIVAALESGYRLTNSNDGGLEMTKPSIKEALVPRQPSEATFRPTRTIDVEQSCPEGSFKISAAKTASAQPDTTDKKHRTNLAPRIFHDEGSDLGIFTLQFDSGLVSDDRKSQTDKRAKLPEGTVQIVDIAFKPRSPRGMVYFLGEQVRSPHTSIMLDRNPDEPLFVAKPMPSSEAAVAIEFAGKTWGVPKDPKEAGRSMQAIALIHQIVGIEQSREDIRVAPTVLTLGE